MEFDTADWRDATTDWPVTVYTICWYDPRHDEMQVTLTADPDVAESNARTGARVTASVYAPTDPFADPETIPMQSHPDDDETLSRIVREILDPVDAYVEGAGPEGPWYYRSLRVQRVMNQIRVYDVDGELWETFEVPDLSSHDDPHGWLRERLDMAHRDSLDAL